MRFPVATFREVRRELGHHVVQVAGARRQAILALILLSVGAYANVMVPRVLGGIVDIVVEGRGGGALAAAGGLLVVVALLAAALSAAGFYVVARIAERVIADLRESMVGTALGLPVHRVEEAGTGDLVSRSTDDVSELSTAVTETIPVLASSAFTLVATVCALVTVDWQFLLVPCVAAPVYVLGAWCYLRVAPDRYASERATMAERARRILEAIHGRDTVRAFCMEQAAHDRIHRSSLDVVTRGFSARTTMTSLQVWMSCGEFLMIATGLVVAYFTVQSGTLTVGAATGAMLMLIRLRGPIMGVMRVLDTIQSGYASLARIVGVTAYPPLPVPPVGAPAPRGEVVMEDVSFTYDDASGSTSERALDGVSFAIKPGETVAVVGRSGAGKTTVAALVSGLRVPTSGAVTIDGENVSELSDEERVARIAMVSQEVYVFSGTLRENLTLAKPDATDDELEDALKTVGATWFQKLADGLDTIIGARGHQLEPYEAQQLAFARILLLDPAVVVMDEATAEAGSSHASNLEEAAAHVARNRAALVVAHRLDQARRADNIVVMDNGRIIESGTHDELIVHGGAYARMWNAWQEGRNQQ
ncbi:ABC transporter ATP-binding protein [Corynebacterium cystitidis]|uniref:ABC-type multidrug transport system, ATPase and permease component n=1 Tax=Corynebacterium cystitidis DSM 20524 TaxID=1121357 RepID=A0A1H9PVG9_9CORY|nr:ABC transporter ATP-binding protein [Corynebacterium cystitidis]WJY82365.1 Putative multidrug export ATP-binding/permease protein [Corynebacterium cystitidis DSM 20524]SER52221.1 ABC-type multidrug transport system, ATPase and permease component [Corynebacterium cystitidis DSM 20524]SNV76187.1 ABC-type multidrug/protein/lipid transport system, ATPase component [Corynebacterium cystitidis]